MPRPVSFIVVLALAVGAGAAADPLAHSDAAHRAMPDAPSSPLEALADATTNCEMPAGTALHASEPDRCLTLAYVWSPSMPLSRLGTVEARRAARVAGVPLTVLRAHELHGIRDDERVESLRTSLVASGATVHFPALAVVRSGRATGTALLGYKSSEAYGALLPERLARATNPTRATSEPPFGAARGDRPTTGPAVRPSAGAERPGAQDIEVLWTHEVSPRPGAFFRRVPATSFIAYDQRGAVHLRDLSSGRTFQGPGWIDFVPTPRGHLFVTPGPNSSGLEFYSADEVFAAGRVGSAEDVEPLFVDRVMSDQYPSVGILASDPDGRPLRYRILVSWFSGLAFREYDVRWRDGAPPVITPTTSKLTGCPGRDLSTPIMSKDGRELAARDEGTGTTKVFRLEANGNCRELFDLGRQTSKVGFSDDGNLIAYSAPDPSSGDGDVRSTTYVLDREEMRTTRVPRSGSAGLVIPELVGADSLLIAVRESPGSRSTEFRLLCCVD